ncbi:hypothetical protein D3C85_1015780 [compost metagenome]
MAWAFSAPITSAASGTDMAKKVARVNMGVVNVGMTKAISTSAGFSRPRAKAAAKPTSPAASTGGTALTKRMTRKKVSAARPAISGTLPTASTAPTPKRIIAPAIIAMTMGIGSQRINLPITPLKPSSKTSAPLMMKAPTASRKSRPPSAVIMIAAPGIE